MAKSSEDLAHLLDIIVDKSHLNASSSSYTKNLTKSWSGLRVGALNPEEFFFASDVMLSDEESTSQMVTA